MARRSSPSRGSSAFGRNRSPSPSARRAAPPAAPRTAVAPQPAAQVAPQPTMAAPSPAGGFMANVAATAAGVAGGHVIGHAITGAFMGGKDSEVAHQEQAPAAAPAQAGQYYQANQEPCKFELDQFLQCAQTQSNDLTLCEGFNQVLRECKVRYGQQLHQ